MKSSPQRARREKFPWWSLALPTPTHFPHFPSPTACESLDMPHTQWRGRQNTAPCFSSLDKPLIIKTEEKQDTLGKDPMKKPVSIKNGYPTGVQPQG